jgi:hypothetical protein
MDEDVAREETKGKKKDKKKIGVIDREKEQTKERTERERTRGPMSLLCEHTTTKTRRVVCVRVYVHAGSEFYHITTLPHYHTIPHYKRQNTRSKLVCLICVIEYRVVRLARITNFK